MRLNSLGRGCRGRDQLRQLGGIEEANERCCPLFGLTTDSLRGGNGEGKKKGR